MEDSFNKTTPSEGNTRTNSNNPKNPPAHGGVSKNGDTELPRRQSRGGDGRAGKTPYPAPADNSEGEKRWRRIAVKSGEKNTSALKKTKPINNIPAPERSAVSGKQNKSSLNELSAKKRQTGENKLKIIPLGGLGEIGKNMTVIQYENSIIVIDSGLMFPEDELLGIDMVIPDYTYLQENREKIKALIISHGHEDHIGAVPYMVKEFPHMPVYGSRFTLGLIKSKLVEHRLTTKMMELKPRTRIQIGPFVIEPVRLAHSIPGSMGFAIHTPIGVIMVISDFKLDMTPIDGGQTDLGSISRLGEQGVLLLLMDSTNVEKEGFTPSERTIGHTFDRLFRSAAGRIILTSFASNVHRIQQAIWAAEKCGRKVAIVGRGMQNVSAISQELGYLEIPPNILIDIDKVDSFPPGEILILTTGSQGEPLSGLTRMSANEHKQVRIVPGDIVIISATPVPGNERLVGRTIDNLYRLGAEVIYEKSEGIHVSGHANREELRLVMNIVKPHYFMPIHGEYRMLYKHALLARDLGIAAENIFVMENGQVLEIGRRRGRINGKVTAGRILIDGFGIGDVGNAVLKERKMLSEGGIVVVNIIYSKKSGKIVYGPEIFSKGFIFERDSEHIIEETRKKIASICVKNTANGKIEWNAVRTQLRNNLSYFINDNIGRRPIVLPLINEV